MNNLTHPRYVASALQHRLKVMPAVVLTGARQTGKSTLAKSLEPNVRAYFSFDDLDMVDLARKNPEALVEGELSVTLDEVQRVPDFLLHVKRSIDARRISGRFLLTGSANLLLMQGISESLAGRASYLTLLPMTRREQLKLGCCGNWEQIITSDDAAWQNIFNKDAAGHEDWRAFARRGGFPTPAVHMKRDDDRKIWFDGYVQTYLERDLQTLSTIAALPDFRRLMRAACLRIGQMINQTEISRDLSLKQPTVHRYLNLLETSHLLVRLPAYSVNRTKRLLKSPKLYWGDVGLACFLAGAAELSGAHLENLLLLDLLVWRSARLSAADIFYWRTISGEEVDLVIEADGKILPIEIKATNKPRVKDAENIIAFQKEYGKKSRSGLLMHTGTDVAWLTPTVLAVPWWKVI